MVLDEHTAAHIAQLFRAFSDTSRVRIPSALIEQEISVNALAQLVGISNPVPHIIRAVCVMKQQASRRQEVYYRVEDEHVIALFRQGVRHIQHG
jgi:ArsR family transcriptional regulator